MDVDWQAELAGHQPGTVVHDRYQIQKILGQGGSGITYVAADLQQDCLVALKALSLRRMQDWKQLELFEREAQVLAKLDHPQIPRYLDHFHIDTATDRSFYIVQALAPGQNLAQRVQAGWRSDEAGIRKIIHQVLEILTYLHHLKPPVVHRDLKPQNLVMSDDGKVYLVDFGAVQETYYNTFMRSSTMVGTFGYMAPEQFRGQAAPQTDLYALGATVLFLLTHRSPAELPQERLRVGFRAHVQVSESFADWLERCLEPDVTDRMASAKAAAAVLQGRLLMPNWQQVVPWRMVAGLTAATALMWFGFDSFKYDLLQLSGLEQAKRTESLICQAVKQEDQGAMRSFLRFGNKQEKVAKLLGCNHFSHKILQLLLEQGVDVNLNYPRRGGTLLYWAVSHGSHETVQLLLERGANVNSTDDTAYIPLHAAVERQSSIDTIHLLLAKGANVNAKDNYGKTPLHIAVDRQSIEIIKLLLAKGADIKAKDHLGNSVLDMSTNANPYIQSLLLPRPNRHIHKSSMGACHFCALTLNPSPKKGEGL